MTLEGKNIKCRIDENNIAVLTIDLAEEKVNKLSTEVMEELNDAISELNRNQDLKGLVITSGKKNIFIAGADISEIENITDPLKGRDLALRGQEVLGNMEKLPFHVVAAIHGAALGGGLELALACHFRILTNHPKTVLGLPEVKLGIHPGFGGTQRLPRLIGIKKSLDIILTGKNIYPQKALRVGLADKVVPFEYLMAQSVEIIKKRGGKSYSPPKGLRKKLSAQDRLLESSSYGRSLIFNKAEEMLIEKTRGHYPATIKALNVIREGLSLDLEGGLALEAASLGEMAVTEECKNLISIFYLQEKLKKEPAFDGVSPCGPIEKAATLGAGVMGGGIAQLFADRNIPVTMKDLNNGALGHGLKSAAAVFKDKLKKRIIDQREFDLKMDNISTTLDYDKLRNVDIVIEAVVEKMEVKKTVLAETEPYLKKGSIFATNTSSLSITEMASAAKRPDMVAGMHFFNPVHKMPLVEVIRGEKTSDETTSAIVALTRKLGKTPVVVKDREGFLVNRLLMPYLNEAVLILEGGSSIEEIDKALLDFGMPMGGFILLDEIGLDIGWHVAKVLENAFGERMKPADLMKKVLNSGRLGKKNFKGYYCYSNGKRTVADKSVRTLLEHNDERHLSSDEIVERCIYLMVNEAALCLEEEVVEKPEYVDAGMVFGAGFPPFRGGLLRYADKKGLSSIAQKLEEFSHKYGERFTPAKLLTKLAGSSGSFYS